MIVGVDLGVTHYRVGVVEACDGKVHILKVANTAGLSLAAFCESLACIVRPLREQVEGVGVAVPGFCDRGQQCIVTTCGTVPFLESCELAKAVGKRLNAPAWVDNDARAHAEGEYEYGGWGKPRSLVVMTLGTGVGLAWRINGQVYPPPDHGAQGGHMAVLFPGGNPCYCGIDGCLESFASGTAIAAAANERLARFYPSKLRAPAESEQICALGNTDDLAQRCVARAVESLRAALHTIHHLYFPDIVVLGGSVARGLWPHLGPLRKWFAREERFDGRTNRLVLSRLGDKSGVLGAAAFVRQKLQREMPQSAVSAA